MSGTVGTRVNKKKKKIEGPDTRGLEKTKQTELSGVVMDTLFLPSHGGDFYWVLSRD